MRKYTQHTKNELNTQKMSSTHKNFFSNFYKFNKKIIHPAHKKWAQHTKNIMVYSPIIEYVLVKNSVNRKGLALGIYSEGVIFYECDGITSLYVLSPGKHIRFYESHRYDQFECTDDDFFCFGSQYGKGTDENHFQALIC